DADVRRAVADAGLVDCTATTFRPPVPGETLVVDGPRDDLLPATHSLGMLARGVLGSLPPFVHVYFHDTDLLDARRVRALRVGLGFLALKRTVTDLRELQLGLRPAKTMSFANSRG
ncbi:MAG TPA: hypothetical protein VE757_07210, partial [Gaiellaceae bacterium]|nr:hypothetical protein [Gaiellaceae bacterium]